MNPSHKEPWSTGLIDTARVFSLTLAACGGSHAIATAAVAPLERIKVDPK